jgi:hypothetical protein
LDGAKISNVGRQSVTPVFIYVVCVCVYVGGGRKSEVLLLRRSVSAIVLWA